MNVMDMIDVFWRARGADESINECSDLVSILVQEDVEENAGKLSCAGPRHRHSVWGIMNAAHFIHRPLHLFF